jgi:dipeptidyl aminopeptidase/acylaminoacyl peptidase
MSGRSLTMKRKSKMRKIVIRGLFLLISLLACASALTVAAAQESDGQILGSKARSPLPAYESLDDFGRGYFTRAAYEEARTQTQFDILEITYASDGLHVPGLLISPKVTGTRKWPAIIFNRGGNGELGSIRDNGGPCVGMNTSCLDVADLYLIAKAGFVVIASDYRYQGPTAKRDEWGGVEVDDVLNLVPALKSLDYVDSKRLYMLGLSRGGTMTYLAIKRGIPIKAAAVIGGVTDVKAWVDSRPEMNLVNGNEYIDGFRNIWSDYEHRAEEEYRMRSAVYWADQINVPILILHSRTDRMVPVTQALRMAEALQEQKKIYALHIYERDGHPLPQNREGRNRMIVDWFNEAGQSAQ